MNKRGSGKTFLIITLVVVLLGGIIAVVYFTSTSKTIVQEADDLCQTPDFNIFSLSECYLSFALENEEAAVCDRLGEFIFEEYCENPDNSGYSQEECDIIEDSTSGGCIGYITVEINDPNFCENGNTQLKKDYCYLVYATQAREVNICDKIVDPEIKLGCESRAAPPHRFIMDAPFGATPQFSVNSITDTITFEVLQGTAGAIYLVSSSDGANDAVELNLLGGQYSGACTVNVISGSNDVISDDPDPEPDGTNDNLAELPWPAAENIQFSADCTNDPSGGPGADWNQGDNILAEIKINYQIEGSNIQQISTGDIIAVSS